jgi:outer membrane protein assembly factor BamE (lipoprotein component of BamABCDE complex)
MINCAVGYTATQSVLFSNDYYCGDYVKEDEMAGAYVGNTRSEVRIYTTL